VKRSDLIRKNAVSKTSLGIIDRTPSKKDKDRIAAAIEKAKTPIASKTKRKPCGGCGRKRKNRNRNIITK